MVSYIASARCGSADGIQQMSPCLEVLASAFCQLALFLDKLGSFRVQRKVGSKWNTKEVRLKNVRLQDNNILRKILVSARHLEKLELMSGGQLEKSLMNAIHHGQNLRSLILSSSVMTSFENIDQILRKCPKLNVIDLGAVLLRSPPNGFPAWSGDDLPNLRPFRMTICESPGRDIEFSLRLVRNPLCLP